MEAQLLNCSSELQNGPMETLWVMAASERLTQLNFLSMAFQ